MVVLEEVVPAWRDLRIFEASPAGAASIRIRRECRSYTPSVFRAGAVPGEVLEGIRTENLECLTFENDSFDVVVTQDVLEHVPDPAGGLKEIARVLRPGGVHIYTVPWDVHSPTQARVERRADGTLVDLLPRMWHGDPYNDTGALVITDWGSDIVERVEEYCGMATTVYIKTDYRLGLRETQCEVFVSRKI